MGLNELMRDEEFKTAVERAESSEEVVQLFQAMGVSISINDVENVFSTESREMTEQELETVSGGGWLSSVWSYFSVLRRGSGFSNTVGGKSAGGGGAFDGGGSR